MMADTCIASLVVTARVDRQLAGRAESVGADR